MMTNRSQIFTILAALVALTGPAVAQTPAPSARSFGLANSYDARARGYEAAFWNPANLAMPGSPGWSVGVVGGSAYLNNNSLSYGQIEDLYGEFLDDATKSELLADIRRDDPDRMFELSFDLGASAAGVSFGRFALGIGAIGAGNLALSPDAMEVFLFGNAGESGQGGDFDFEGSRAQVWALSGASLSYGHPIRIPALDWLEMSFGVGATLKIGVAHGLARFSDRGSLLTSDPLAFAVDAEVVNSTDADAGRVWSVDLGTAMDWGGRLNATLTLKNALSNVSWNEEEFDLTRYILTADFDSTTLTDSTVAFRDLSEADQQSVRGFLEEVDLPRSLTLAGLYHVTPRLSVSVDYTELIGGELRSRWDHRAAAGAELRLIDALPLRAGLATNFEQLSYTGGIGAYAGPLHVDFSIGRWGAAGGDGVVAAFSLSVWPGMGY